MPEKIPKSKVNRMLALVDSGMPPERVAKRFRISAGSVRRYLRKAKEVPILSQPVDLSPRKKGYVIVLVDDATNAAQALLRAAAELMEQ